MNRAVAGVAALGFALSGCATVQNGPTQHITITTDTVIGATCTLANATGTYRVTTPGVIVVHKTRTNLRVTCRKDGYRPATMVIHPKFNDLSFGKVAIGLGVGMVVDAASGASYDYPPTADIPMTPEDADGGST